MNKLKRKDNAFRKIFKKNELKTTLLKNIQSNFYLTANIRLKSLDMSFASENGAYKTKINNRCIKTVSKKNINKKFKLSRIELLRLIRSGKVYGFKKSVW